MGHPMRDKEHLSPLAELMLPQRIVPLDPEVDSERVKGCLKHLELPDLAVDQARDHTKIRAMQMIGGSHWEEDRIGAVHHNRTIKLQMLIQAWKMLDAVQKWIGGVTVVVVVAAVAAAAFLSRGVRRATKDARRKAGAKDWVAQVPTKFRWDPEHKAWEQDVCLEACQCQLWHRLWPPKLPQNSCYQECN